MVVNESEEALFIFNGLIVQKFGSGRHILSSATHPFLSKLQKKSIGNKALYIANIIFIQKTDITEIRWGTDSPIQLLDPKYHFLVNLRANGSYSIQIDEVERLMIKIIGLNSNSLTKQQFYTNFRSIFISHVKNQISKYLIENSLSVLELNIKYLEIAEQIKIILAENLKTYGITFRFLYFIYFSSRI